MTTPPASAPHEILDTTAPPPTCAGGLAATAIPAVENLAKEHTWWSRPGEPGSLRELLLIAVPMIISAGTQSLMHIIDRVFLTQYGTNEIAAALPAGILYWTGLSMFIGMASYINTFVAQYEGADRPDRVCASIWQGIYFAIIAGAGLMLLAPLSPYLFRTIGHGEAIESRERIYFSILCLGSIPALLASVLNTFFTGRGETALVMWVSVASLGINAVLDWVFIFGYGIFPEMGMAGAALTDVWANMLTSAVLIFFALRPRLAGRYRFWKHWKFDPELVRRIVYYGGPAGLLLFIDVSGWSFFMNAIGWLGKDAQVATNLTFNLNTLGFIPIIGLGIGVSTLVGTRIAERRPDLAARTTLLGAAVGLCHVAVCIVLYLGFPDALLYPFQSEANQAELQSTKQLIIPLLYFVSFYSVFDTLTIVLGSAIRGAGDTRFSMVFTLICVSLLLILPTMILFGREQIWAWFSANGENPLPIPTLWRCWTYCSVYITVLAIGFTWRFLQGKWRVMSVVEPDVIAGTVSE